MTIASSHLQWPAVCEHWRRRLRGPRLRADGTVALARSTDPDQVRLWLRELSALEHAVRLPGAKDPGTALGDIEALQDVWERARRQQQLSAEELRMVWQQLEAMAEIHRRLIAPIQGAIAREAADVAPRLQPLWDRLRGIDPLARLHETLQRSLQWGEGDPEVRVADTASPALARARDKAREAKRTLIQHARKLVRDPRVSADLADDYYTERQGRIVLPMQARRLQRDQRTSGAQGIVHGASASGQTLYVEPPGLVADNNALRAAETDAHLEERRVLQQLSAEVAEVVDQLQANEAVAGWLDGVRARWQLSRDLQGRPPIVVDGPEATVELSGMRHPLMVLSEEPVVANDVRLRSGRALILSGPNAGGKTVALKTVGLCALMVQAGLWLPTANEAKISLFRGIVTDVGDDQSIERSLSTFTAHMGHVLEAFDAADTHGAKTLVLLDEVSAGTDPEQGAALAEAIVRSLVATDATVMVTTHFERLKLLASAEPERFSNAAVGFDLDAMQPTFRIEHGLPGSSSAFAVARRLGLPAPVLQRAEAVLSDERLQVDELLRLVEAEREQLAQARQQLEAERAEMHTMRAQLEARLQARRDKAHDAKERALRDATAELRALEQTIADHRKQLRKQQAPGAEPPDRQQARALRQRLETHRPWPEPPGGAPPEQLEVGQRITIPEMGVGGSVEELRGDRIVVTVPMGKLVVDREQIRPAQPGRSRQGPRRGSHAPVPMRSDAARHFGADARPVGEGFDNSVDVRGFRAEEAVARTEQFLAEALPTQDVVIIRHGHGSGALRSVVREHLRHLDYVRRHRGGLPQEGGDAVTVVWLGS